MAFRSLPQMFFSRAHDLAERTRYRHFAGGRWRDVSWRETEERVLRLAAALVDLGVAPGTRIGLFSATRPEWVEIDLAILACGAHTIPVYQSVVPAECGYILANAEAEMVFVENAKARAKVDEVTERGFELDGVHQRLALKAVIGIDDAAGRGPTLAGLLARGAEILPRLRDEIARRVDALDRSTLATIVYTSGTTGPPKGVPQTHGNHLAAIESTLRLGVIREGEVDFFFLPLAHSFARLIEYVGIAAGTVTAFARSIDTLIEDLPATRPHLVPAVPRVYEKIFARIQAAREASGILRGAIFDWAVGVGRERSRLEEARQPLPLWLRLKVALAHRLVFARIHELLGGQVRLLLSGGAPLSPDITRFFHAIGLLILEGYGLTETTPVLTVNRPDRYKLGTVGLPLDCCEIRLAEDGEILARGANVVTGYYRRPDATAESWDAEGWFHTGDIGVIDEDGFLRITDRKKDLIKTSGGKYVAPQKIENLLKLRPYISQAVVLGDQRKYCVALVTLDAEEVARWAREHSRTLTDPAAMAADPEVRALVEAEVAAVNRELASWETIKRVHILPHDFSPETGELTPSLKVKRKVVAERYREIIDAMYR